MIADIELLRVDMVQIEPFPVGKARRGNGSDSVGAAAWT